MNMAVVLLKSSQSCRGQRTRLFRRRASKDLTNLYFHPPIDHKSATA